MNLFIVERWGLYQQGIVGIYTDFSCAVESAKRMKNIEPDKYHGFIVKEVDINHTYDPEWGSVEVVFEIERGEEKCI